MALLFMDGFDHYNVVTYPTLKWTSLGATSNSTYLTTGGRRGGGAITVSGYQGGGEDTIYLKKTLASNYSTIIVGFAFYYAIGSCAHQMYQVKLGDGTVDHIYLYLDYTTHYLVVMRAPSTILGTYEVALTAGVWYYIELKVTISDTVGVVQLRVNEYLALDLSNQDTRNGGNEYVNTLNIGGQSNGSAYYQKWTYDDLYICDTSGSNNNDFLGDCRIDTLLPSGAGYSTQWTPSAGSNYQCVDDALFDNGTDYISENDVNNIDSYALGDLPTGIAGIKGIQTNIFAKRTDSGVVTKFKPILRPVSSNHEKTEVTTTINYYDYTEVTELNPDDSAAWEKADIDGMEVGVKLTVNPLP
jgi:hypothetical protein